MSLLTHVLISTSNTVVYNICAACNLCSGDDVISWSEWAQSRTCDSTPQDFHPPPQVQFDTAMIPEWAYQRLTSAQFFDVKGAAEQPSKHHRSGPGTPNLL